MPAWRNLVDATDLKCAPSSDVEIAVFQWAPILLIITIDYRDTQHKKNTTLLKEWWESLKKWWE